MRGGKMSDNYQAVYDAVRSKFGYFNSDLLLDAIRGQFDISCAINRLEQDVRAWVNDVAVWFRPKLYIDGNMWCALYGDNLQDGVAGFGDSPSSAMVDFNKNWYAKIKETPQNEPKRNT
jgi:hypothetical protein